MLRRKKKKREGSSRSRWVLERSIAFVLGEDIHWDYRDEKSLRFRNEFHSHSMREL